VIVSESFQRHFEVKLGDLIRLNTPVGPREFPVVGVEVRYNAGSAGGLRMDLATFDQYWSRPGSSKLLVWASGDERVVENALQSGAGKLQELIFVPSREVERTARSVLDRYSRPVYGLLGLIALLAGSAVANLLMSSANDLRGDMALLECLGASHARLTGLVLIESCIVGLTGVISGFALAMALAVPIRAAVADQFGWLISWSIRPEELALLASGTVGASMLIGLATGRRIRRTISWNALTPE
jgi:ABC-type lipoprotein release transport system permease subunit